MLFRSIGVNSADNVYASDIYLIEIDTPQIVTINTQTDGTPGIAVGVIIKNKLIECGNNNYQFFVCEDTKPVYFDLPYGKYCSEYTVKIKYPLEGQLGTYELIEHPLSTECIKID